MIIGKTLEELQSKFSKDTIKKYEATRPAITVLELGRYEVVNSSGGVYEVLAGRRDDGSLFIACKCRGALEHNACYHAAGVLMVHTAMVKAERLKRKLQEVTK